MIMTPQTWEEIRKKARERTDREFASEASSLIHLTDEEIKEITPSPLDKEKLAELMSVVEDATKSNEEKAEAVRSISGLAEVAVSMIRKLA